MKFKKQSPIKTLSLGFILISLVGGIILCLPISSSSGKATPYLDALFTSTSAVTTTGLIVVDTGSHFNPFGQIVIIILIQIGGLGYMIFFVLFALLLGNKLSMQSTLLLHESLKRPFKIEAMKFTKLIIFYTFLVEFAGAIALSIYFSGHFPLSHSIYSAIFHSVSAFNTAGFSIYKDSLSQYNNSIILNFIVIMIFTAGCLGFWVIFDSIITIRSKLKKKRPNGLSVHTKLVYLLSMAFFLIGTIVIFYSEHWMDSISIKNKILNSVFQTLSATSTTGFNSIDIGQMSTASMVLIIGFMFIGSGSGSTAGGIKITTFGVLLALLYSVLRQKKDVNIFNRSVSAEIIRHSFAIMFLAVLWVFLTSLILCITESGTYLQILFEVVSAFGTVGLSTGITSNLTSIGKILIIIAMLIGRIGPLSLGLSVLKRHRKTYKYPTGDIYVG